MKDIRKLAMLLAASMIVSMIPMGVFAEDDGFIVVDETAVSDYSIAEETAIDEYSIDEDYGDLYAAATAWPATKNIKTYAKSTKNNTKVYKTAKSTDGSYGTIYASDLITINGYDNGRYYVTYPISGGTKKGYVSASDITSSSYNVAKNSFKASGKITTYRRSGGGTELGYISKGDVVYRIATSGDYTQVIYPISGGYKMGWIYDKPESKPNNSNKIIDDAVDWAVSIAKDDSHGYSQKVRWGPSYDCASFVITAYTKAGVNVKGAGATYTGDMKKPFEKCGFKDVTSLVNLNTGKGLKKGDVLLRPKTSTKGGHTALVQKDGGTTVEAYSPSKGIICNYKYRNDPWTYVLRYGG